MRRVAGGVLVQNWRKFGEKPAGHRREAGETTRDATLDAAEAARIANACGLDAVAQTVLAALRKDGALDVP